MHRFSIRTAPQPCRSESHGFFQQKHGPRRRRRALNCNECRELKVSCDRKLPCSRCQWRGKAGVCSYASNLSINTSTSQGHRSTSIGPPVACSERVGLGECTPLLTTEPPADKGMLCWKKQNYVHDQDILPRLSPEWQLASVLTSLYKQLSCVVEFLDNPFSAPVCVRRGQTHWESLLGQCAIGVPDLLDHISVSAHGVSSVRRSHIYRHSRLPSFPFDGDRVSQPLSLAETLARYLPPQEVVRSMVGTYFGTIEGMYRLFHIPTFEVELERFWSNPSAAAYDWVAQLLAILALSTQIEHMRNGPEGATPNCEQRVENFLRGACQCLDQLSYPFQASLETVRTLCLIVTAKRVSLFSCHERDACGPLLDTAVNLCVILGLGQDLYGKGTPQPRQTPHYLETRVWTTVKCMYLHHAIHTGLPVRLPSSAFEPTTQASVCATDSGSSAHMSIMGFDECPHTAVEVILAKSLPWASRVIDLANCPEPMERDSVDFAAVATDVRKLLRDTESISSGSNSIWNVLQRWMLIVFLRRVLLTSHYLESRWKSSSATANDPRARVRVSSLAMTECAIAILVQQRAMLEDPALSRIAGRAAAELFKEDFFVAALVIGVEGMRGTGSSSSSMFDHPHQRILGEKHGPVGGTVLQGLHWCRELWARDIGKSICNFAAYSILGKLLEGLCMGAQV